jgi:DNA-binding SARP family transcriptional activator
MNVPAGFEEIPSSPARLSTLGSVALRDAADRDVDTLLAQPKRLALLVYLAVNGATAHRRDSLMTLLWPEFSTDRARNALNKSIHFIRTALGKDVISSRGAGEVVLNPGRLWCDAEDFTRAIEEGRFERAVSLYRGSFLTGFFVRDAVEFEMWVERQREHFSEQMSTALETLAKRAGEEGDLGAAIVWWRRLTDHDSLSTRGVVGLMKALEAHGERGAALLEAKRHGKLLERELEVDPDPDVAALVERLRRHPRPAGDAAMPPDPASPTAPPPSPTRDQGRRAPLSLSGRLLIPAFVGVAVSVVALVLAIRSTPELHPGQAEASAAGIPIVVLPFRVNDPGLDLYREGLVDLLSTSLDGIGDLRVIEAGSHEAAAQAGGRFVASGSLVAAGKDLRLAVELHDLERNRSLGSVIASGPPDSVLTLVDRLAVGIVENVLGRQSEPGIFRLPAVMTTSLPALRAYLVGERAYGLADFGTAIEAYEQAVREDSTFALAHYRLRMATGWSSGTGGELHLERAMRHLDRLPAREAWTVRALFAWDAGSPELGLRLAQQAVQHYPRDPEAWYVLGELHHHFAGQILGLPTDAEAALERAVELAPSFAPYQQHFIEWAFLRADDSAAASRIRSYAAITKDQPQLEVYQLAYALGFGGAAERARAERALPGLPTTTLRKAATLLDHPGFWPTQELLMLRILDRPDRERGFWDVLALFENLLGQGRYTAARERLEDPVVDAGSRAAGAYLLQWSGARVSPDWYDRTLQFSPLDTLGWLYAGAHAIDSERPRDLEVVLAAARREGLRLGEAGDTVGVRSFRGLGRSLEGYRLWREGKDAEALLVLAEAQRDLRGWSYVHHWNMVVRWWLARLLLERGRSEDAATYLTSIWLDWEDPHAAFELARIRQAQNRRAPAADAYRYALLAWHRADSELAPLRETARRELARLGR